MTLSTVRSNRLVLSDPFNFTGTLQKNGVNIATVNDISAVTSVNGQTGVVVLTTADINDSANRRYVTDAQQTVITNTSGTNTGDQTNITGNAGTVTVGDAGGDTTTWVLLGTSQTGSLSPATDGELTYNATTNALTTTTFVGNLTGDVTGNVSGNAGTVTNATFTTALTVNTGTLTLTANVDNTSVLTIGSGAVSVSGANTGNQNLFQTIAVAGQDSVVADTTTDTLTIVAGSGVTITTTAVSDTVTISATGSGGDVTAAANLVDNTIIKGDGGLKGVQDSGITIDDSDNVSGVGTLNTHTIQGGTSTFALYSNNLSVFAATTSAQLAGVISDETGSGLLVFATSPTLTTPNIGVATATSINRLTITTPATGSTLTIADGKTLTTSNTLTFTGTDGSSVAFGTGGTVAYTANKLDVFAATSSSELAGVISDETGTGLLVFGTAPIFASTITVGTAGGTTGQILLRGTTSGTVTLQVADAAGTYTLTLPTNDGNANEFLQTNGSGVTIWASAGTGDVTAALSLTDNALVRGDGGAKGVQTSAVIIDDTDNVTGMATLTLTNTGLHLLDTNASHDLIIRPGSDLTADKTLTITTGDFDRTITLNGDTTLTGTNTGDQNLFQTIAVAGQSDVVADSTTDTLTLVAGTNITITTDAATDTITITAAGSSGANTALSNLAAVAINTSLISDTDITDDLGSLAIRWKDIFAQTLSTGDTATDTLKLRGYDTDGAAFVDILTITAAATVTADLDTSVTIGGSAIYRVGGTDVAVADGGTGKSSWTQYLIPYADTTTSFSQIAIGTSGQVLTSNGAGAAPTFQTAAGTTTPVVNTYTDANTTFGDSTTQFDVTNPSGTTFRYTYDGTGTNPSISAATVPTGMVLDVFCSAMVAGNRGRFTVTGSGSNYFEVTNAAGVVESNKTISNGFIAIVQKSLATWTKPAGLRWVVVEVQAAGGGGGAVVDTGDDGCGGGGGGGYSRELIAADSLGATEAITFGYGGQGGVSTTGIKDGRAGGDTSFGSHLSATGGAGGEETGGGGAGGTGSGGNINIAGGKGGEGGTDLISYGGGGGNSQLGSGGGNIVGSGNGNNGTNYGGGGGGGATQNSTGLGGDGATSIVIVTEYY